MFVPIEKFLNVFNKSVYEKIVKETTIPYDTTISFTDFKKDLLPKLYKKIVSGNYFPSAPRQILQLHKSKFVARSIPLLSIEDECFYYFAIKYIEEDIAKNRVDYTFGGWRTSVGNIKKEEQDNLSFLEYCSNSYNSFAWRKAWKEFTTIIYDLTNSQDGFTNVITTDISNFYDSINFNLLYSKLIATINPEKVWILEYLFLFLKHWNKKVDNYKERSTGLPQTEFGDQSRLLANLYLQEYDVEMKKICDKHHAKYVRYADDQLIFLKDKNYQEIMSTANAELIKIGLNLNTSKTCLLTTKEIQDKYLLEELELIEQEKYDSSFKSFFKKYTELGENVRYDSYLKYVFNKKVGLEKFSSKNRLKIIELIYKTDILYFANSKFFSKVFQSLSESKQTTFVEHLFELLDNTRFNSFYYYVQNFLKENKLEQELNSLQSYKPLFL